MRPIPQARETDATLALLREGYPFILRRRKTLRSNIFRTRILLRPVLCMGGPDAAAFFYDSGVMTRQGAMPSRVVKLLQDKGSVQTLEGEAHLLRKAMFLAMMSDRSIAGLVDTFTYYWRARAGGWSQRDEIVLFDEIRPILTAAVCEWAGIPTARVDVPTLTDELTAMIEDVAKVGPRYWRARLLRRRAERWAMDLIDDVRTGALGATKGSALALVASQRNADGSRLDREHAAVELLNVLRPVLAVDRFIVYCALALHEHGPPPGEPSDAELECFAQEVRRYYPFFPFIGGCTRTAAEWDGHAIEAGQWVLLDLYGTNRDPSAWTLPEKFDPARFAAWDHNPYTLVAQGGGDVRRSHRCPGERIALELMKQSIRLLIDIDYRVPDQDFTIDLTRIPALPRSGFVLAQPRHC